MQAVYVDLFFLINFSMDFLCLFLTARIIGVEMKPWRGILGAALGGIYADLALFLPPSRLLSLGLGSVVCVLLCAIALVKRGYARSLPLYALVFAASAMALGGVMTALFHLFNQSTLFDGLAESEGDGISVWVFALLALVSGAVTLLGGRFFARRAAQTGAEIELCYGGRSIRLCAMTDSGNLLRDPVSGKACIVADLSAMERLLPSELIGAARTSATHAMAVARGEHVKNLRLIPTRTAAGDSMLLGVRMESVTVHTNKKSHPVDAYVALAELGESAQGKDALLPSALLIG